MTFEDFNLSASLLRALNDTGLTRPTTIQEKGFPVIMSGADVVGIAQTGTGKTLAYLLPCLRLWKFSKDRFPQILILVPTRELVLQVATETEKLTAYMNVITVGLHGGDNIKKQVEILDKGLDIVVATPGRMFDLVMNGSLRLKSIKRLVIDEVDEMLNLGFRHQLTAILDLLPPKRQNLMFSATLTPDVEELINIFFYNPKKIEAAPVGTPLENIVQIGYSVPNFYTKVNLLKFLLSDPKVFNKVLVFVSTKKLADQVYEAMEDAFPKTLGIIHSNKAQNNRFNTVKKFDQGEFRILIATDIIARGIDISDISHVINFDIPEEPENYINRIGRTGRIDKNGTAISFIVESDRVHFEKAEAFMKKNIALGTMPESVPISKILTDDEMPVVPMKEIAVKLPKKEDAGPSFHEKKEKNKKVNMKITRKQKMMLKYGKPKTRGQKRK
ncbi:MAG TPA: DEAD/DEAH box helicase [Marinilabiliales bacterium]|jgi:ATP-dependent RNA helicase RhlE|nr:MAG: DEAD/DEAH box helicase [Bacteroidetes bacterium GWA2_40_14]OFX59292.1 MAG: DEAD/DEAH box helicase [Bacteroidetes bacterium GWC2_40_13]OFX74737.1 MAG: DEAD/DEAH box helicase [Bacteroidetes bacterium GWD2_40_43]OFX88437.1 MAG: DEAD/DEAH box helicase [Bacteroidetes bacterium GWE2_40_63]OFY22595.1 MAG: DEAD/DEAH box helicase [Bacteroidetes bacterium GWF2_40_13]OFZ29590.1 MAG: DEAD/DEAH box helicase [Bacteroidetes bacterium RIFOXYC2_FULL_40_12]HAN00255.1 DEAD/DEAH box helicase [Marinilabil